MAKPQLASMVALNRLGLGLGIAGAMAPYVALQLKLVDPVLPFLVSSACLAAVTLGMVAAERSLAGRAPESAQAAPVGPTPAAHVLAFLVATALGAGAFQWHSFVASAPLAMRFAPAADLPLLLPVFWVGFNLALWPASLQARQAAAPARP